MIKCVFIILMIRNIYHDYLDTSLFQKQYEIEKFKNNLLISK